jgi:hypothetical protein
VKVTFEIEILAADERGLSLRATGPIRLEVDYQLRPSGSGTLVEAQITLAHAAGITGALASRATNAILGAGALRFALRAIAAEAEQLQRAAGRELEHHPDARQHRSGERSCQQHATSARATASLGRRRQRVRG